MSSPVAALIGSLLTEMGGSREHSVFLDDARRQKILKGIFTNYYADCEASVIFDTSRAWCARMNLIDALFPEAKVIACVRHMPWVIDSVERLVLRNVFQPSGIFGYTTTGTVYSRAEAIAKGEGMVGFGYNALKEAFFGPFAHKLMLVQYETLVTDPARVLQAIYDFTGTEPFTHDFDNVSYDADEFDRKLGTPGLHHVRRKVAAEPRRTVLPPDVFQRFENDAFWRNPDLNPHRVAVI